MSSLICENPDLSRPAIDAGSICISWNDLRKLVNEITYSLDMQGVPGRTFVAHVTKREPEWPVVLASLYSSNRVWLPVDPGTGFLATALLEKATPEWMIVDRFLHVQELLPTDVHVIETCPLPGQRTLLQVKWRADVAVPGGLIRLPDDVGYAIPTSGSTGGTQIVLGSRRGLEHFIRWEVELLGASDSFRVSQLTSVSFDPVLRDVFLALCSGGTICVPEAPLAVLEPKTFAAWLDALGVEVVHCTPTLLRAVKKGLDSVPPSQSLRALLLAGEELFMDDVRSLFPLYRGRLRLFNLYGPTETTLAKFCYEIDRNAPEAEDGRVPVGYSLPGSSGIVLRSDLSPCVTYETGEVYIRTAYRSHGYFDDAELNAARFAQNPFNSDATDRIFRTGDLGYMKPDGSLMLVGRNDRSMKIRGVRVDLGVVENEIRKHRGVREVAVRARMNDKNLQRLVAYVVLEKGLRPDDLRRSLRHRLSPQAIPAAWVEVTALPKTHSGKVAYRELLLTNDAALSGLNATQLDDLERAVLQIFNEILPHAGVGPDEELLDLGGQSIEAAQIAARISNRFGVECGILELTEAGTPRRAANVVLAKLLARVDSSRLKTSVRQLDSSRDSVTFQNGEEIRDWIKRLGPERSLFVRMLLNQLPIPASHVESSAESGQWSSLSFAQQRFWFMQKLAPEHPFLHYTWAALLSGEVDPSKLQLAFNLICERHDVIRMAFQDGANGPRQSATIDTQLELEMADFSGPDLPQALEMALVDSVVWAKRPFRFGHDLLLRTRLVRLAAGHALLVLCGHVVVSDGWSKTILLSEAAALYRMLGEGIAPHPNLLPLPQISFTQFAHWEREAVAPLLEQHSAYWMKHLGNIMPPDLPYDLLTRGRPVAANGGTVQLSLSRAIAGQIRSVAHDLRISTTAVTLAAFLIALRHWSGQDNVIVQFPIPNRSRSEFETAIGCFTETALLRESVVEAASFGDLARQVAARLLEAIDRAVPFELLLENLWPSVDRHDPAVFPIMFAPQPAVSRDFKVPGVEVREITLDTGTANFPLHIFSFEKDSGLDFLFRFATNAFRSETIKSLAELYQRVFESCLSKVDSRLPFGLEVET